MSVTLPRRALIGPLLTGRYGERVNDVIAVIGQALIDLVAAPDGTLAAKPGGGPYNTARTIGRLGGQACFLGRLSDDAFGRLLRAGLAESGVTLGLPGLTSAPTTLAMASISASTTPPTATTTKPRSRGRANMVAGKFVRRKRTSLSAPTF